MSWDTDQWISFDDEETFKQKVDWANQVGFSGSLIWASDLGKPDMSNPMARLRMSLANICLLRND